MLYEENGLWCLIKLYMQKIAKIAKMSEKNIVSFMLYVELHFIQGKNHKKSVFKESEH